MILISPYMHHEIMHAELTCPRHVQIHVWDYSTEQAYYQHASSDSLLQDICIPFLAINAEDDPVRVLLAARTFLLTG